MQNDTNEFLRKLGMKDDQTPEENQWDKVIIPEQAYLIMGDKRMGKSGLAYWLLENYSRKYELLPATVGIPRDKQYLLPDNFLTMDSPDDCIRLENAIIFIDEAGLQLPVEDIKAREYVVNFLSLPGHRNQILILAFHFPRLVLGRYLPFFDAFLMKQPPYLLQFAGKRQNDALTQMMLRAEERFSELASIDEAKKHTYVVAPRLRWQGILENPLPSFWTTELSKVWAGVHLEPVEPDLFTPEDEKRPERFSVEAQVGEGVIVGFKVSDPDGSVIGKRAILIAEIHRRYPAIDMNHLENARISYSQYHALVELRKQAEPFDRELLITPRFTIKGWHVDDPERKAIYPITTQMARESVPIGAMGADGMIRSGEINAYQNSAYVVMEHRKTGLRWVKQIY